MFLYGGNKYTYCHPELVSGSHKAYGFETKSRCRFVGITW